MPYTEVLQRAPDAKRASRFPLRLTAPIDYRGSPNTETTVPDQLFGLEFLDKRPPRNRHYFFLEADRSTMTQERIPGMKSEDFRSIKKKMRVYHGWRRETTEGLNKSEWGIDNFRVLFLTGESRQRCHNMIANNEDVPPDGGGWNQFLFAYKKDLFANLTEFSSTMSEAEVKAWARSFAGFLHAPWTDGEGRHMSFVNPSNTKVWTSKLSPEPLDLKGRVQT